jgi:predicted nucleic acid-binding protein
MKFVLDSSVALKWALVEKDSDKALRLLADYQSLRHELVAPDVLPAECAHALTRAEQRGIIPVGKADMLYLDIALALPALHPYQPLIRRAIAISSATRQGSYDCLYVALAEREACSLITADDKLVAKLQLQFPFIIPLSSLP